VKPPFTFATDATGFGPTKKRQYQMKLKLNFGFGYFVAAVERPAVLGGLTFRFLVVMRGIKYLKYKRRVKEVKRGRCEG
jgi:hypothetical protein